MTIKDSLRSVIEEAVARIIPHIAASIEEGLKRFVVLSNDTDVLVLLINYFLSFLIKRCPAALDKIWVG